MNGKLSKNSKTFAKIGIFDSGLGGLVIAKSIFKELPRYDYIYLGDTKNLPYGNKTEKEIYNLTIKNLEILFSKGSELVVIACNTVSAKALRKVQQEFLPKNYPDKKVLGVIVPTIEEVVKNKTLKNVGIICTQATQKSHSYKKEVLKLNPKLNVFEQAAPKLVPLIEEGMIELAAKELPSYLKPLQHKKINALVLGCTHYPILKNEVQKIVGKKVKVYSQEEIIPKKLKDYLARHKELKLSKNSRKEFWVTEINEGFKKVAKKLFKKEVRLKKITA